MSIPDVFDQFEASLAVHGFARTFDEVSTSFGSRMRGFARGKEELRLTFDGRDGFLVLEGGAPWRDLAVVRTAREPEPHVTVAALLAPLTGAGPDSRPAG